MTLEKSINSLNKRIEIPEIYNRYIYILLLLVLFSYIYSVLYNFDKLNNEYGTNGQTTIYLVIVSILIFFLAILFSNNKPISYYSNYVLITSLLLISISIMIIFLTADIKEIRNDELVDPVTTGVSFLFSYVVSSIFTHKGDL